MEEGRDLLPSSDASGAAAASATKVFPSADTGLFSKGRYKFWALAAILLLAFWTLLTGTVTLRWSARDLSRHDLDGPVRADLDILEMEESEKVVRHMWDTYAHSRRIRMPRFWQEAFEAAYEELAGDDLAARDAAITEIARMSVLMGDLEARRRNPKAAEVARKRRVGGGNITSPKSSSLSSADAR